MSSHDTDNTSHHSLFSTDRRDEDFVVFVPVSNPNTQGHLVTLGAAIANQRDGRVIAVTIVRVPDQTSPLRRTRRD